MVELRQLESFLAVLRYGSVTRAAEKLSLSPGAVSLQMQALAAELGTDLFVRAGRNLAPTPAAHRLAEHARGVIRQVRTIRQEFESDPQSDARTFHFATGATALIYRLGRPLRRLRRRFPRTPIEITILPTEEMVAGLHDRRFDLALISLPFPDDQLDITPLYSEEMLIIRPSNSSVAARHVLSIRREELADAPFILYPKRSNMRTMIDAFLAAEEIEPRVIMEADDTEVIRKLVESGFGFSVLPEYALRRAPRFFQTFRLRGKRLIRTQALATARSDHPRPLTRSIGEFLRAELTPRPAGARRLISSLQENQSEETQ
jgi:DNA-binding transcriptional LysR family regulator